MLPEEEVAAQKELKLREEEKKLHRIRKRRRSSEKERGQFSLLFASHRIASHRILSHCIASHRIAHTHIRTHMGGIISSYPEAYNVGVKYLENQSFVFQNHGVKEVKNN